MNDRLTPERRTEIAQYPYTEPVAEDAVCDLLAHIKTIEGELAFYRQKYFGLATNAATLDAFDTIAHRVAEKWGTEGEQASILEQGQLVTIGTAITADTRRLVAENARLRELLDTI